MTPALRRPGTAPPPSMQDTAILKHAVSKPVLGSLAFRNLWSKLPVFPRRKLEASLAGSLLQPRSQFGQTPSRLQAAAPRGPFRTRRTRGGQPPAMATLSPQNRTAQGGRGGPSPGSVGPTALPWLQERDAETSSEEPKPTAPAGADSGSHGLFATRCSARGSCPTQEPQPQRLPPQPWGRSAGRYRGVITSPDQA